MGRLSCHGRSFATAAGVETCRRVGRRARPSSCAAGTPPQRLRGTSPRSSSARAPPPCPSFQRSSAELGRRRGFRAPPHSWQSPVFSACSEGRPPLLCAGGLPGGSGTDVSIHFSRFFAVVCEVFCFQKCCTFFGPFLCAPDRLHTAIL